ncbi:MAG TPA: DNA translocase FtsK [Terriglobia bacterium]|nr:DNA translocase FtsK [Terriglobia bacterium]
MSRPLLAFFAPTEHRRWNEFIGLLLATIAILTMLSLISFNPDDPSLSISRSPELAGKPQNVIGVAGAYVADTMFQLIGYAGFLIPVFIGIYAFCWLASRTVENLSIRVLGLALMALTLATAMAALPIMPNVRGQLPAGGLIGRILADNLDALVNPAGSFVIVIAAFLISLFLATTFSFSWAMSVLKPRFAFVSRWADRYNAWREERVRREAQRKTEEKKAPKKQVIVTPRVSVPVVADDEEEKPAAPARSQSAVAAEPRRPAKPAQPSLPAFNPQSSRPVPAVVPTSTLPPSRAPESNLPSTTLLHPAIAMAKLNEEELRQRAAQLEQKAREFDVEGSVQQIHPGPVVTTFEFKPEPGVKYAKITGLGDDLCLALEAESVRIDRIPGKATVGIEVPNNERATIVLRELLESTEYSSGTARLPLALGKDIRGRIVVSDLQKMPHLLAAGSTGTGKSVSINAMILSLLYRARPDQVKMIMIDPKRLELGLYQDIPHLLVPVVTEPQIAQNALRWAVTEMENRYKKLAKRGVRSLEAYNDQARQRAIPGLEDGETEEDREPLPYIVIVIDELADLMMTAAREVEESITRLAQMARAVGIHLILATQRPSVDVITGLIKANFPARVSFRVTSKVDSRTILDSNGAEQLLGRGDMLFLPPGSSRLMRLHGALVTEEEVAKVVDFLKQQGKPTYNEKILAPPEEEGAAGFDTDGELDEMYDDAVRVVIDMGKASTSLLQRRLHIGYGRAAAILDGMERAGLIGPPEGSKARAVLVSREEYFGEN